MNRVTNYHADRLRWYAVRFLSMHEATAEAHLKRQGFETFVPRIQITKRHARRLESVKAPLYPRYGFVRIDVDRDRWRLVNGTTGVASLVMACDLPLAVPRGIVEALVARLTPDGLVDLDHGFRPGDSVRLGDGPFVGQLGILKRLNGVERVEMLVSMMNRTVRVHTTRGQLLTTG